MHDSINAARLNGFSRNAEGAAVFEHAFPKDAPVFAGHFPGRPILPGVLQLEMTRTGAELVLETRLGLREVRKAKFQRPILPGEIVRMELDVSEKEGAVEARAAFSVEGQTAGESVLLLFRSEPT